MEIKTYQYIVLVALLTSACSKDSQAPNVSNLTTDIRLRGTPVVKVVSSGNQHWLMTETIVADREEPDRTLNLVSYGKLSNISHALLKDEFLSDMALAPEPGQLWIAAVSQKDNNIFVLRLINRLEVLLEIKLSRPIKEQDPRLRGSHLHFLRNIDDYVRIVSDSDKVFVVGRNSDGFPFITVIKDQKIIQQPSIIGPALFGAGLLRDSGVYGVMDQLSSKFKLLATSCSDKIIVSWLAETDWINLEPNYFGDAKLMDNDFAERVAVFEISKENPLDSVKPAMYKVGIGSLMLGAPLLQGISCDADGPVLSGSSRILEGRGSAPFVIRRGEINFLKSEFQKSATAQAVLDIDGKLILGGSTEWSQNPGGLSIDGGLGFLKIGDEIETFGETRTEVRSLSHTDGLLCYAGMIAGPTTHSHDHNPKSITGDGFLKCRKL